MKDDQVLDLTHKFIDLVKNALKVYKNKEYHEVVEKHKFEDDDVTNLDIKTQEYIIKQSKKILPNLAIIGEEGTENCLSPYKLIIDPIDGTVNFKNNIKTYGTQICLLENDAPVLSVLALPEFNEIFYANKFGAFKNDTKISASKKQELKSSIICLGDFQIKNLDIWQKHNKILTENVKRIRMFGSSCFDSCMLAGGNVDGYIIYSNNAWDIMPGKYLMEQAGANIFFDEKNNFYIFANSELLKLIKSKIC